MRAAPAGAARAAPWTFGAPADRRSAGLWPRAARCPSYAPAACRRPRRAARYPATPALACSGLVDRVSGQGQDRGLGRGFRGGGGVVIGPLASRRCSGSQQNGGPSWLVARVSRTSQGSGCFWSSRSVDLRSVAPPAAGCGSRPAPCWYCPALNPALPAHDSRGADAVAMRAQRVEQRAEGEVTSAGEGG